MSRCSTSHRGRTVCDALPDFPVVARRPANVAATSAARGAVTRTRMLFQVVRGNVAVLGDASGSVDAITGEGLLSALRQAQALAARSTPANRNATRRSIGRSQRIHAVWRGCCCCSTVIRSYRDALSHCWRDVQRCFAGSCACIWASRAGRASLARGSNVAGWARVTKYPRRHATGRTWPIHFAASGHRERDL